MRRHVRGARVATIVATAACLALAGCNAGPSQVSQHERSDHGVPGDVLRVEAGVLYYPACGDEALQWDGLAWYPYQPTNIDDLPADPLAEAGVAEASEEGLEQGLAASAGGVGSAGTAVGGQHAAPSIAPPGPGDDTGTLVIFEGALAYWESESGDLATWLTRDVIQYAWEC